jgi:hypothetical protein
MRALLVFGSVAELTRAPPRDRQIDLGYTATAWKGLHFAERQKIHSKKEANQRRLV